MTYQDLFADYYSTTAIGQMRKNLALARFLNATAETSPSVNMLMIAWKKKHGGASIIHPDQFIAHCNDFGFEEWSDLERFILTADKSGFNPQHFSDCIDPPFPEVGEPEEMVVTDLHWHIRNTGFPVTISQMDIGRDSIYELYSYEDVLKIIDANPSNTFAYQEQSRDCDDFVRIYFGWLSRKNKGNMATGFLSARMLTHAGNTVLHALVWALTKEKKLLVIEPQSDGRVWTFGTPFDWPGYAGLEPREMRG